MQLKYPHGNPLSLDAEPPLVNRLVFLSLLFKDLVMLLANVSSLLAAAYV